MLYAQTTSHAANIILYFLLNFKFPEMLKKEIDNIILINRAIILIIRKAVFRFATQSHRMEKYTRLGGPYLFYYIVFMYE